MLSRLAPILVMAVVGIAATANGFVQSSGYDHARLLFQQRRWAEAAAAFEEVEKEQPEQTEALLYRGKCLVNLGKFSDAASILPAYLAEHPQSDDAAYLLAYVQFRENKPKESLKSFTEAAKIRPPAADDLKIVALDYVLLNDYADAGHYLEQAVAMDPGNNEARYHLGRVRYQQNQFDLAIAAFQEVLRRDPDNVKAENNLGLSFEGKNQMDQAIAAYHKAIDLEKSSNVYTEQPYLNLAILLAKSNQASDAVPLLTRAAEIDPKSSKVRYELGRTYFNLKRLEDARREAEEAVRLDPNDGPAHYSLGRIYQRLGKSDLAAQQFKLTEALRDSAAANSQGTGMAPGTEHQ